MQQYTNPLFTPLKKNNLYITSKDNNFSSPSGILWSRMKEPNTDNRIAPSFLVNNNSKGRKLIEDFNKFTIGKLLEDTNNNDKIVINETNQNLYKNNNIPSCNILNSDFSLINQSNQKDTNNGQSTRIKSEIIKNNKSSDNILNSSSNAHNMFFTDYGLGYKCNCQKTQCNKYYCQCYREKRYCFNCNCQGCQNQKPEYSSSNKHPIGEEKKSKKDIIISCTCTKSGCNKNYCECYKNKVKCNSLCRCRNCENCENGKNSKNKIESSYECCRANSVFIINNKIVLEDIKTKKKLESVQNKNKKVTNENLLFFPFDDNENFNKKRKRKDDSQYNISDENNSSNKKSKVNEEKNNEIKQNKEDFIEEDLFDKNGKLILVNFKL